MYYSYYSTTIIVSGLNFRNVRVQLYTTIILNYYQFDVRSNLFIIRSIQEHEKLELLIIV